MEEFLQKLMALFNHKFYSFLDSTTSFPCHSTTKTSKHEHRIGFPEASNETFFYKNEHKVADEFRNQSIKLIMS